jgi:hypothetical protein
MTGLAGKAPLHWWNNFVEQRVDSSISKEEWDDF